MSLARKLARLSDAGPGTQAAPPMAVDHAPGVPSAVDHGPVVPSAVDHAPGVPSAVDHGPVVPSAVDHGPVVPSAGGQVGPRGSAAEPELVGPANPDTTQRLTWLRTSIERLMAQQAQRDRERPPPRTAPHGLPGERRSTPTGEIQVVEERFASDRCHGNALVAAALAAQPAQLAALALDDRLRELDLSRLVYFDTETTGLAGGTGTLAFLIGLAWFEEGALVVQQLLLRQPGSHEEGPMLAALAERVRWASGLVSFNGKSFDWPLLRSRFVMNRAAPPEEPLHLDLLHCARRVYKRRLTSARLTTIEREVLGFDRVDDLESALIPQRYFDYLRGADGACICPVLEHNRDDLIALAALLGDLAARYTGGGDHAEDRLSLAELALRRREVERALGLARGAAEIGREDPLVVEALAMAARLHKRRGEVEEARLCLREALGIADSDDELAAPLHLALAKLLEHQLRDVAGALGHARRCGRAEEEGAHRRRLERLERRAAARG